VLQKPLLVVEFGKSRRDPGYGSDAQRDAVFGTVYAKVYQSARAAGLLAGALFCQLLAVGMDSYGDGYEVVLGRARRPPPASSLHGDLAMSAAWMRP
jgi:mannan endo-1,4-beta-mannosidase